MSTLQMFTRVYRDATGKLGYTDFIYTRIPYAYDLYAIMNGI